jgi:hypothetical protein
MSLDIPVVDTLTYRDIVFAVLEVLKTKTSLSSYLREAVALDIAVAITAGDARKSIETIREAMEVEADRRYCIVKTHNAYTKEDAGEDEENREPMEENPRRPMLETECSGNPKSYDSL